MNLLGVSIQGDELITAYEAVTSKEYLWVKGLLARAVRNTRIKNDIATPEQVVRNQERIRVYKELLDIEGHLRAVKNTEDGTS